LEELVTKLTHPENLNCKDLTTVKDFNYTLTMAEKKVMGPASYFPSIEKKYGKPIEYWMKELKKVSKLAHMEQVAHLKEKFELGHGHANALVAYFRKKQGL
jgi:hypothetical protein